MARVLSLMATFRKPRNARKTRKPLTKAHKEKISRALRSKDRRHLAERRLGLKEQENRGRTVRNIGYLANAAKEGLREARLTARWLGIEPSRRRVGLAGRLRGAGDVLAGGGSAARNIQSIASLLR